MTPVPRKSTPIEIEAAQQLRQLADDIEQQTAQTRILEDLRRTVIRQQRARGVAVRAIAEAAGLSYQRIAQLTDDIEVQ